MTGYFLTEAQIEALLRNKEVSFSAKTQPQSEIIKLRSSLFSTDMVFAEVDGIIKCSTSDDIVSFIITVKLIQPKIRPYHIPAEIIEAYNQNGK